MKNPRILSQSISSLLLLGAIAVVQPLLVSHAQAASLTWDAEAANNLWQDPINWVGNTGFPGANTAVYTSVDDATFSTTAATGTIDLGGTINIRSLLYGVSGGNAASFTIGTASNTLNFTTAGGITINSGVTTAQNIGVAGTTLNLSNAAGATATFTNNGSGLLTVAGNIVGNVASGNGLLSVGGTGSTTVTGTITKPGAGSLALLKTGAGTLTLSNGSTWSGAGALGYVPATSVGFPLVAREGTLLLNGGTHNVAGEAVIGGVVANGGAGQNAKIQVDAGTLAINGYLSVGRGNGVGGVSSDLVLNNNAVVTSTNYSGGYNAASTLNLVKGSITMNGTSSYTVASGGAFNHAESTGSNITMTLNNSAQLSALGAGVKIIGNGGTGVLTLNNSSAATFGAATVAATATTGTGFTIGSSGGNGTLTLNGTSTVNFSGIVNLGYNTGTGTANVAGGTWTSQEVRVGTYEFTTNTNAVNATGNLNVSGGTMNVTGLTLARGNQALNNINGNATLSGGVVNVTTGDPFLGYNGAGLAKMTINGGTLNVGVSAAKWFRMGELSTVAGQLDISSGSLNLYNGSSLKMSPNTGTGAITITQSGGNVTYYSNAGTTVGGAGVLDLQGAGTATTTNTYNLNGGTLTVPQIVSSGTTRTRTFNFNGGTLKAATATTAWLNLGTGTGTARANVRDNGALIDTNSLNVTIPQALLHSNIANDLATDGGLTKSGAGTLTLSGANTYTGTTNVNTGTLLIANSTGSGTGTGPVNVNAGAIFTGAAASSGVTTVASTGIVAPGNAGIGTLTLGGLTLNAGSLLNYEITDPSTRDLITVTNSDGLTINGGAFRLYQPGGTTTFSSNGIYNLIGYTGTIGGTGVSALSIDSSTLNAAKAYTFGTAGGFVTLNIANAGATPNFWNVDANGSWTTTSNWSLGSAPNAAGAIANFGGGGATLTAPRVVTLDANQTVGTIGFNSAQSYTISGANTLTLNNDTDPVAQITNTQGSHTIGVALNSVAATTQFTILTAAETLTVSGPISGTTNLIKNGDGTLNLTAANSYAGSTSLSAGTLALSGAGTLGGTIYALNVSGGTLNLGGTSQTTGAVTLSGGTISNGTLSPAAFSVSGAGTTTMSANLTGATGVTKDGAGTLTLSGTNTYTGNTVVNAGVLAISSPNSLGDATNSVSFAGGALQVDGTTATSFGSHSVIGFPSAVNVTDSGNTFTIASSVTSAGTLVKQGPGKLVLSGTNTFGASVSPSIQAGTVEISGTFTGANTGGGIDIAPTTGSSATLNVLPGATITTSRVIIGGNTANTVGAGAGTLIQTGGTINSRQWFSVGSGIGTGATAASGVYTNSGGILNVNAATNTQMEVANFSGTTGTVNLSGSGAINLYNNAAIAMGANANAGNGTFNQDGGTVTFYSDAGITPGGTGGLRLGNAATIAATSTYTYNLNGGTLSTPSISHNVTATNLSGHVFNFNGGTLKTTAASATFIPTTVTTKVLAGGARIDTNGFDSTLPGVLAHDAALGATADGGLVKNGAGVLTLSGANTYTGNITINAGTLNASAGIVGNPIAGALGNNTVAGRTITVTSGTTLNMVANDIFGNQAATAANLPALTVSGVLNANRYNQIGALTLNGGTLTSANTVDSGVYQNYQFLGDIAVEGSAPSAMTSSGAANFNGNHLNTTTRFTVADATGNANADLTVAVPLLNRSHNYADSAGGLTKAGPGTMTLSAANPYTGATTVEAGTLLLSGSLNGSATEVLTGGSFGGTGSVLTATVRSGGTLTPGGIAGNVGTLSTAALSFDDGSTFSLQLDATGIDKVTASSSVSLAGTIALALTLQSDPVDGLTYTILDSTTAISGYDGGARFAYQGNALQEGQYFNVTTGAFSQDFQITYVGDGGTDVALLAVPEPSTAVTLLGGLSCLLGLRRLRRRSF